MDRRPFAGTRLPRPTPPDGRCRRARPSRSTAAAIARNTAGATEYGAWAARLVRPRRCGARDADRLARAIDEGDRILGIEPDDLVEDDAVERARGQRRTRRQGVADVADGRGSAANRFRDPFVDAGENLRRVRIRVVAPRRRSPLESTTRTSRPAGTRPRRYDSSRCVCALTSPGRIATLAQIDVARVARDRTRRARRPNRTRRCDRPRSPPSRREAAVR